MVRNVKGFTFVELMISMIILSIVLTIVTGTMVYISKRNSAIDENNHGYQIAKEKLIELQGGGETVNSTGSDEPNRNGIDYKRSWKIETDSLPYPVTVTVSWVSDGKTDSVIVVGYVNAGVCEQVTGNSEPGGIKVFNSIGEEVIDAVPVFPIAKNGDVFVCSLYAFDKDTVKGDIVKLGFHPDGAHNDNFYINDDSHLYSKSGTQTPGTYYVKLVATDCANLETTKDITINITEDVNLVVNPNSGTVTENSPVDTYIATMSASPSADGWSISGGDPYGLFKIDASGNVTVNSSTKLNFEDNTITNPMELNIKATLGGKEGIGKLYVTIEDTNEAPTGIYLTNDTISIADPGGTFVGLVKTNDPDANESFFYMESGGYMVSPKAFELRFDSLFIASPVKTVEGSMEIVITTVDQGGTGLSLKASTSVYAKSSNKTCLNPTSVNGGDSLTEMGCYFHAGEFQANQYLHTQYFTATVNGDTVIYNTNTSSFPPMIDGGYYIELTSEIHSASYFVVPNSK